jgi:hypothetical protein
MSAVAAVTRVAVACLIGLTGFRALSAVLSLFLFLLLLSLVASIRLELHSCQPLGAPAGEMKKPPLASGLFVTARTVLRNDVFGS